MENNPYAPSASSLVSPSEPVLEEAGTGFRDLSGISGKLSILLLLGLVLHIVGIASSLMQANLLSHPPYTLAQASANDLRERLVHVGQFILLLITMIVFGRWIYLAHKNLPELGARYLRFTPGWSVGCFFVPFLNLWAPYQAMRDLAKASRNPHQWQLEDTSFLIVLWWILWLIEQALSNAGFRLSLNAHTLEEYQAMTLVHIVSGVLSLPVYIIARYIVRRVWKDQSETYTHMTLGGAAA